jgi:DNA-binding transcriptional MerR regulator
MRSQLSKPAARSAHKVGAKTGHGLSSPSDIPDKLYFKIGEVARICAIQTYVLRFWESEFPQLRPSKSGTGQRLYSKRDVEMALRIRHLLYEEGFTIPGARQTLQQEARGVPGHAAGSRDRQSELPLELQAMPRTAAPLKVEKLKTELRAILGMLSTPLGVPRLVKDRQPDGASQLFID